MFVSEGLVEQHIHGCFGIDFMSCTKDEMLDAAKGLAKCGVTAFFPAVMTDELSKIKERIAVIKSAAAVKCTNAAEIAGIYLEGPFINPDKAGIHEKKHIQPLDTGIFKEIEDEIIKIAVIAPELDKKGKFAKYLKSKNIKVSAGHTLAVDLKGTEQVTHLYNAMGALHHRNPSTAVSALLNDNIYAELIADSKHVSDEVLKLTFKFKPLDKIFLISDALPMAHSALLQQQFAGQMIYNKNGSLVSADGTLAGSSMLLCDIVKNLADKKILTLKEAVKAASFNQLKHHKLQNRLRVCWEKNTAVCSEFIKVN